MEPFAKQPHRFNISAAVATCREAHRSPRSGRMKFFGKRLAIYRDARLRPVAPKIFGLWAASSSLTRRRSATSRRNRKISSWSSAIRLSLRLGSSSLRHRCKVMTLTPSVRAISLCSFPCLAKSFACASFVATSTRECRFTLAMAACPAAATSIGFAAQLRQLLFFGQARPTEDAPAAQRSPSFLPAKSQTGAGLSGHSRHCPAASSRERTKDNTDDREQPQCDRNQARPPDR
jgi:hypothetical protein